MAKLPPNPFQITAYYSGNTCIIDAKHPYQTCEVLCKLFDYHPEHDLALMRDELKSLLQTLLFKFDVNYSAWENYDKNVYRAQKVLNDVKELLCKLPLYRYITNPDTFDYLGAELLNNDLRVLMEPYIDLLETLTHLEDTYGRFLDEYVHSRGKFLTDAEIAEVYEKYAKVEERQNLPRYRCPQEVRGEVQERSHLACLQSCVQESLREGSQKENDQVRISDLVGLGEGV